MPDKHAILLVRVSTLIQDYEPQIEDLKKYANSKGFNKFHFIETKESGLIDTENKLGTNQMCKFIEENPQYKTVFATELSRLGRRQSILHHIKEWLIKNNVQIYLKDVGYALFEENGKISTAGEIMFTLYGYFAESEIKQKKERFVRAKRRLMEMGFSIGGKTLFGYQRIATESKRTTLIEFEKDATIVRTIFSWYVNGIDSYIKNPSIKTITLECIKRGFPKYTHSKRNVNKLLKEPAYTGYKVTNNKRKNPYYTENSKEDKYLVSSYSIKYPVIIDKETFQSVQNKLVSNNSKAEKSSYHTTLLSKLIQCNKCECHFNADYRVVKELIKSAYRCSSRSNAKPCSNRQSISMAMLDSAIWSLIKSDLHALAETIAEYNPDVKRAELKSQLQFLEQRKSEISTELDKEMRMFEIMKNKSNLEINSYLVSFENKASRLNKEMGTITEEITKLKSLMLIRTDELADFYKIISENLDTIENSRDLLKKYINLFVREIKIVSHDSSFSVLKVLFQKYSPPQRHKAVNGFRIDDPILDKEVFLFLNKKETLKIKAVKTCAPIVFSGDRTIQFCGYSITLDDLFDNPSPATLKRIPILKEFQEVSIKKLEIYSPTT